MTDFDAILADMGPHARAWYEGESNGLDVRAERAFIEPGRTLSEKAMKEMHLTITRFVLVRMLRRWQDTGEPPTVVTVHVTVDIG